MKIGFIGLGTMGTPMALHLVGAGHALFVNTMGTLPEAIAATSAQACANATEVARDAGIVFTMVPDTPDVEALLFGANGMADPDHSPLVKAPQLLANHQVAQG